MMNRAQQNKKTWLFGALLIVFLYLIAPFLPPVAMGAILATVFFRAMGLLTHFMRSPSLRAFLITIFAVGTVILPTAFIIFWGAQKSLEILPMLQKMADGSTPTELLPLEHGLEKLHRHFPMAVDNLKNVERDVVHKLLFFLSGLFTSLVREIPSLLLSIIVIALSLYYFLREGRSIVGAIKKYSIFTKATTRQLLFSMAESAKSVVLATIISGILQAVVITIAGMVVGMPNVALLSFAVFWASFVPMLGSSPVTISVTFYYLMSGHTSPGLVLGAAATVSAVIDNVTRPLVLRGRTKLHPLLGFISAFGGLMMMGFYGIFVGPILAGIIVALIPTIFDEHAVRAGNSASLRAAGAD